MPKVLVIGATGFVGLPAAQALVRAGHIVYGLTRSAEKAKALAADEIIPVVGEISEPNQWLPALIPTLDVIIEAVGGSADISKVADVLLQAATTLAQKHRPAGAPKLSYIYTSGAWVYGDNRKDTHSDTTPLSNPLPFVAWRPAQEQRTIQSEVLNGIVIRPSLVYGRSGSITALFFKGAKEGKVTWFGKPGGRLATIHADDLAGLYVLTAEKAPLVGGHIFTGSNDASESTEDFLQKLVQVSGAKAPHEYVEPSNPFFEAIDTTVIVRPYLARALLGWRPLKPSLVDGLEVYYNAWKATV